MHINKSKVTKKLVIVIMVAVFGFVTLGHVLSAPVAQAEEVVLHIDAVTIADHVYDGTTNAQVTGLTVKDSTEVVVFTQSGNTITPGESESYSAWTYERGHVDLSSCVATFASKNVGDSVSVSISGCTLAGQYETLQEYELNGSSTTTGKITQREATARVKDYIATQGEASLFVGVNSPSDGDISDWIQVSNLVDGDALYLTSVTLGVSCNTDTVGTFANCLDWVFYIGDGEANMTGNYSGIFNLDGGTLIVRPAYVSELSENGITVTDLADTPATIPGNACLASSATNDDAINAKASEDGRNVFGSAFDIKLVNCNDASTEIGLPNDASVQVQIAGALDTTNANEFKVYHNHLGNPVEELEATQGDHSEDEVKFTTTGFSTFQVAYDAATTTATPQEVAAGDGLAETGVSIALVMLFVVALSAGIIVTHFNIRVGSHRM